MAGIDNWIKKQLKKGYKKEQIKESMRRAGYSQNTIDSVDYCQNKKNQNKFLIALTFVITILVIILIIYWYNNNYKQELFSDFIPNTLNEKKALVCLCEDFLNEDETIKSQVLDKEGEVLCEISLTDKHDYGVSFKQIPNEFYAGRYYCVSVDLNKIIEQNLRNASSNNCFSVCGIVQPKQFDVSYNSNEIKSKQNFLEGNVFCIKNLNLNVPQSISFIGTTLEEDYFYVFIHLLSDNESVDEVLTQENFFDAKSLIESYEPLWIIKKPIKTRRFS